MKANGEAFDERIKVPSKAIKQISSMAFMIPFIVLFSVFFLFPFFYGIFISFFNWNLYTPENSTFAGFQNYYNILFNSESIFFEYFWKGLSNTLIFVAVSVPLLIVFPLVVALLLDIQPWGYKVFRTLLFMPTVFSISAVVLMWRWQFYLDSGFINAVLKNLNLPQIAFLNTQPWAWIAILVVTVWWTMGTNMVILGAGLKNINKTMYEAAAIDGASYIKTVFKITVPSLSGQMIIVFIMTVLSSFNIYGQPDLLTGGGPDFSTTVLMMRIRSLIGGLNARPGIATAMSICMGLIMMFISALQGVFMRRKNS